MDYKDIEEKHYSSKEHLLLLSKESIHRNNTETRIKIYGCLKFR
jgi:hypothetical protein